MAIYTLTITGENGHQHTQVAEFSDDASIIADLRGVVDAEHPAIAIARGKGADIEFLGAWDWCGGEPRWTPDE